ncbi:MAG: YbhN family protein [Candidatus Nanopelagicales bacterium]
MAGQQASSPNPLPPEATGSAPSTQSVVFKVLSAMLTGALLVLIAFYLVPKLAGYASVGNALKGMTVPELLILLVGGIAVMTLNAAAMKTPLHELSLRRAFVAQQASTAVSNVIPGPSGTAARFAILHSWKVSVEDFTRATFAVSVWSNAAMISMPGIAFLILALMEGSTYDGKNLYVLAGITFLVSLAVVALVVGLLRSVPFTRFLGRLTARLVNPLRKLFRRQSLAGLEDQAELLRQRTLDVLRDRGGRLTTITLGNYWLNGLLLVLSLWFVGISDDELPLIVGLATYSVGRLSTIIQVTPGGVGVVEIAYTAVFVAVLGESSHDNIVTGVLVYRLLTYVMPIVVGGACYVIWRRMQAHSHGSGPKSAVAPT